MKWSSTSGASGTPAITERVISCSFGMFALKLSLSVARCILRKPALPAKLKRTRRRPIGCRWRVKLAILLFSTPEMPKGRKRSVGQSRPLASAAIDSSSS